MPHPDGYDDENYHILSKENQHLRIWTFGPYRDWGPVQTAKVIGLSRQSCK